MISESIHLLAMGLMEDLSLGREEGHKGCQQLNFPLRREAERRRISPQKNWSFMSLVDPLYYVHVLLTVFSHTRWLVRLVSTTLLTSIVGRRESFYLVSNVQTCNAPWGNIWGCAGSIWTVRSDDCMKLSIRVGLRRNSQRGQKSVVPDCLAV